MGYLRPEHALSPFDLTLTRKRTIPWKTARELSSRIRKKAKSIRAARTEHERTTGEAVFVEPPEVVEPELDEE